MALWEFLSYVFVASVLGSFTFWLFGYIAVALIAHFIYGPSEQLRSVGTSILDTPEYKPVAPPADQRPRAA